jgi:acyl-CoA reductase-like NAD-dependent aldehyde dehydrogenase
LGWLKSPRKARFKQSGIGREGGKEGLLPYLETKTMLLDEAP